MNFYKKFFCILIFDILYFIFIMKYRNIIPELLIDIVTAILGTINIILILLLNNKYAITNKSNKKNIMFTVMVLYYLCELFFTLITKYFPIVGITLKSYIEILKKYFG